MVRRVLWLTASALLAACGCANVIYRGPVVRVGEETRNVAVLEEKAEVRMALDRGDLSAFLEVKAVRARRVRAERRPLLREYGYYLPFDPLVKTVEFLSAPVLFGLGAVLVYQYWTSDDLAGGVGDGESPNVPGDIVAAADAREVEGEEAVDLVVRDPSVGALFRRTDFPFLDWWVLVVESADPSRTSRALFPSRRSFGALGPVVEGAWRTEDREETEAADGPPPEIRLAGSAVPAEPAGPGAARVPLAG
ncbi:MAG: hypothetical protein MUC63_03545, partial [Planctomycetes bacterium]|nr:hypothetical protein [Planctomycetota bacterium]